jgi:cytochrome c553
MAVNPNAAAASRISPNGALLVGTGLAFASLILVPALATQLGMGTALTGALRIALMRASARVANGSQQKNEGEGETAPVCFACH